MKMLRNALDKAAPSFEKGGKLHKFHALYELVDTFLYTPGIVAKGITHVRDSLDLKRLMITVAVSLAPAGFMALYNTGFQANAAITGMGLETVPGWRAAILVSLGLPFDPMNHLANILHGALYFVPVFLVTNIVGGFWEVIFASVRKHEVNEGFLVTGILFPLILPATIPLWQVAIGISFAVVLGKEVFGGTGMNFLNPALTARAFLFFAYPQEISGDSVWVAAEGFAGATPLAQASIGGIQEIITGNWATLDAFKNMFPFVQSYDPATTKWLAAFLGFIPGSMGETSTLAALLGAGILTLTGIGSWRIMVSVFISTAVFTTMLNLIGSETNLFFNVPFFWHAVIGGWAFGLVFMATDPVSAAMTETAKYWYGGLIGLMVTLIRVINPAFPEGMMLAILFANVFAPTFDFMVVKSNINRRRARSGIA
ncbi:MAG: NADH:ubiquinone reductase (Na(+)-transporting) subunit B [Leptospiraceae bacterium]|nr:NADH:ubiquinone reductase (Na(+)-transporting) subunit B [Leptospiraceae bacterium]MCB1199082.1 NADH:ubiquinone reductase (Na(+)-transporting) subunit B [Leptospiraceae bacterium]